MKAGCCGVPSTLPYLDEQRREAAGLAEGGAQQSPLRAGEPGGRGGGRWERMVRLGGGGTRSEGIRGEGEKRKGQPGGGGEG